ncbi:MAG: flagellar filament capping protein FliD [Actinomycetota bacterium]
MTTPTFNFGGIASGLDTNSIVDQLIQIERNPIVLMQQRQATFQSRADAWSSISTQMSSLRSSIDSLRDMSDFDDLISVRSSNEDAVSVTVGAGGSTGNLAFTVDQLATSHQLASTTTYTSTADSVGAGTLTISVGGVDHDIATTSGTTVENLAAQINESDIGVTANALQIDDTTVKLVLTSDATGEDNSFTATGLGTFDIVQQGQDAIIGLGTDPLTKLEVKRSSNTVTDLVPGVDVQLKATTTEPITIDSDRDIDGSVERVQGFVDALNGVMTEIRTQTRFDEEGDNDGPLLGDGTLRGIEGELIQEVTGLIDALGTDQNYAASIGIEFTTEGVFELDTTKLREALTDDYDSVTQFFARSGDADDSRAQFGFASDSTVPGSYGVVVTQAATQASTVGSVYSAPGTDTTLTIVNNDVSVDITIGAGDAIETAISKLNTALDNAGIGSLRASNDGGAIKLGQLRYGDTGSFTVSGSAGLGLDGTHTGVDAAGTIDGVAAEGSGRTLTSTSGDSEGLGVTVAVTEAELSAAGGTIDLGSMSYSRGLMGELSELISAYEGAEGELAQAQDRWTDQIDDIDTQIERYEDRLALREATIRRQFTAMETTLSNLQSQMSFLFPATT